MCKVTQRVTAYLAPFIDSRRRLAFVLDDTLYPREYSTKTELLARAFDHDNHRYLRGFRALTLGWSDGDTFLPVDFALISSKDAKQRLGTPASSMDQRAISGQRRAQAQRQMNDVAVELLRQALANGVKAHYVLFDSWFSSPKMFWALRQLGLDGLGMIKRSVKVYYVYRKRQYSVKGLYERLRHSKRHARKEYLYSAVVQAHIGNQEFPLRLVFVTNRHQGNNYLVLATTQLALRPRQIIQMYGRRWQIEGYFKLAKQYLRLAKSQIQDYDGLCGHLAVVMVTYDILAWRQRQCVDERTLGDLFYTLGDPLPDIAVTQALAWLMSALSTLGTQIVGAEKAILDNIIDQFFALLPKNLVGLLGV